MCIIVYKPKCEEMPAKEILEQCFINNPDGSGYMYVYKNKVFINKGLMTFDSFYKSLEKTVKTKGKEIPYVLHFRISTQGKIKPQLTHPYPLSNNMKKLKELQYHTNIGVAHNGIISLTSSSKKEIEHNDTMEFITEYLSLIIKDKLFYKNKETLTLISKLCGSKLAILDNDEHCQLIGGNWINNNGVLYSNDTYEPYIFNNYYRPYSLIDDYEIYYNENTQKYDFEIDNCPLVNELCELYCCDCINYAYCENI